ncbi:MAG: nucleoside triphosphate pyrophosphohydrolase [Desulfosalsimonadaceae bacterium]
MKEMDRLVKVMERLRGPGGCPWDAAQNHKSMIKGLIEEAYELADAIENENADEMMEELGDVLLQVVFHSIIAAEEGEFTLNDVANCLADKLIYRHPHVFGEKQVNGAEEVIVNWEKLKRKENGKRDRTSILSGIPETLPALLYALKIQSAASRVGFDWDDVTGVIEKIREEIDELTEAAAANAADRMEDEIGDMMFSVVNLARKIKVDPEAALRRTSKKFATRFVDIEQAAREKNIPVSEMPMDEKERVWQAAKRR